MLRTRDHGQLQYNQKQKGWSIHQKEINPVLDSHMMACPYFKSL